MQLIKLCLLTTLVGICLAQTPFSGPTYQAESANEKRDDINTVVRQDPTTGKWFSFEEVELFLEPMNLTFDAVGDDMPYQFLGLQRRPKLIHSVGVIAQATWTALHSSFTGVLGAGCKDVVLRFSLAREPVSGTPYTPGISVKCLRDGVMSANIFAMYSLQGQDSWNFFKHDLTNHVGDLSSSAGLVLEKLRARFAEASAFPVMIGVSDLAKFSDNGTEIRTPVFPFRLIFHPENSWHTFFPDAQPSVPFQTQLESSLKPGPLYQVYAQIEPNDDMSKFVKIGNIALTSTATTSLFGDTLMFFEHTRMENDLKYRPEWVGPAQEILAYQRSVDNYVYPDLPWL